MQEEPLFIIKEKNEIKYQVLQFLLLFPVFALLGIAVYAIVRQPYINRQRLRQKRLRLAHRTDVPLDQVYSEFYGDSELDQSRVRELWAKIGLTLGLPAEKLRPMDRFDRELRPVPGSELDDEVFDIDSIVWREWKKTGIDITGTWYENTLDDLIRTLAGSANA